LNLESGLIVGFLLLATGILLSYFGFSSWKSTGFGQLNISTTLRTIIPAVMSLQLGIQIILFSLFFSVLGLKK
jgi:hypothetical protein